MNNRWSALVLLFAVRTVMAFQFQTVAALSPFIEASYGVGIGAVGFLLGLYMLPGIVLAIPGGRLALRFGEKNVVIAGLWMMAIGLAIMAFAPGWSAAIAGRLIAGVGGILMNLIMTKMVADWFDGKEIATAMSVFIISWPAGIALALLLLPGLAETAGLTGAFGIAGALAALGAILFIAYRTAPIASNNTVPSRLSARAFRAGAATGATWGFLNATLAVVFGFGVALLVAREVPVESAGRITSLTMVALALIGPLGGYVADRTGRYMTLISICLAVMGGVLVLIASGSSSIWLFVLFGLACGFCAGPVMSLPGLYLSAVERGPGMGVFFTVYYAAILIAPILAGWAAEVAGRIEAAFVVGIGFSLVTVGFLAATRWIGRSDA